MTKHAHETTNQDVCDKEKEFQNKSLPCPRCSHDSNKEIMRKFVTGKGVVLDVCAKCGGMWLDKSEVMMIFDKIKYKQ